MISNATIYRLTLSDFATGSWLDDAIAAHSFVPCGSTQEKSVGFVPPRGENHGVLVESVNGQLIMKLMIETKSVPGPVINRAVAELVENINKSMGRKAGKKEIRELREDVRLAMLPDAFPKQTASLIWINPIARLLVIDAASQSKADDVVTALVKAIDGLAVSLLNTTLSPSAAMSEWLINQEPPAGFSVDRECELKAADESKSVIRYSRSPLDTDEVRQHVEGGMLPSRLALTWNSRVSFVLTDGLILKKIELLDSTVDVGMTLDNDAFDADVAIMTGELRKLIPDLIDELGGEVEA